MERTMYEKYTRKTGKCKKDLTVEIIEYPPLLVEEVYTVKQINNYLKAIKIGDLSRKDVYVLGVDKDFYNYSVNHLIQELFSKVVNLKNTDNMVMFHEENETVYLSVFSMLEE